MVYVDSGAGKGARVVCKDVEGFLICHHWHAEFNSDVSKQQYYDTYTDLRHITCHEFGHTLGLKDYVNPASSCMQGPEDIILTTHDGGHINGFYAPYSGVPPDHPSVPDDV
jgi:hypothetical protein